jgi:hypothetical protein
VLTVLVDVGCANENKASFKKHFVDDTCRFDADAGELEE